MLRTLRREGFESVPVDLVFCSSQYDEFEKRYGHKDIVKEFNLPSRRIYLNPEKTFSDGRALYKNETLPEKTHFDAYGVAHSEGSEAAFHMTRMHHPLKGEITENDILDYPFPAATEAQYEEERAFVEAEHAAGRAARGGKQCTIWEYSWYLRSMEDLMTDMMMDDEKAALILDRITDISVDIVANYARAGCDVIELGDDIGMQHGPMMSTELWEKWLKPRLAKVIAKAKEIKPDVLIFYHSCGHIYPFLEGLIEVGVDILNPVQPEANMPFEEVHNRVGGRVSYWGTVGTQTTLPFGTPDDVKDVVTENLRICGEEGGILIAPTHVVEPEVPFENILALLEAARMFRI